MANYINEFKNFYIQNPNLPIIAIGGLFLLLIIILLSSKKGKGTQEVELNEDAEGTIFASNKKNNQVKKLSLKERIELSWKFLYEITELIISKFSREDKRAINKLGHVLLDNRMRYEHIIDLGIKPNLLDASEQKTQLHSQSPKTLSK